VGIPASFPGGWRPGAGWSFSCLKAVQEWCDVVGDFEDYTHHFDPSDLRAHGATTAGAGSASFGDVAVGVHLHAPFTGPRLYGLVEAALPDVSRPAVSYTDASGSHELRGTEIFGFDPGWVIGAGYELSIPRRIGGLVETRLVFAPGSTRPAEYMISFRACLTAPLPF
jgi:hypothetical protein